MQDHHTPTTTLHLSQSAPSTSMWILDALNEAKLMTQLLRETLTESDDQMPHYLQTLMIEAKLADVQKAVQSLSRATD